MMRTSYHWQSKSFSPLGCSVDGGCSLVSIETNALAGECNANIFTLGALSDLSTHDVHWWWTSLPMILHSLSFLNLNQAMGHLPWATFHSLQRWWSVVLIVALPRGKTFHLYYFFKTTLKCGENETTSVLACTMHWANPSISQAQMLSFSSSWSYEILLYGHRHKSEEGIGPIQVGDNEIWATYSGTLVMSSGPLGAQSQMYYFHTTKDASWTCVTS